MSGTEPPSPTSSSSGCANARRAGDRTGRQQRRRPHAGRPATRVVLGGHLDTVPANGNLEPRREGDTLHGLGSADMKGGLAVLLQPRRALGAGPADRDVTLVFYEGEEVADEHNGLRLLFAERRRSRRRRRRGPARTHRRVARSRVPGNDPRPRATFAGGGRTPPGRGWASTRSTAPRRCSRVAPPSSAEPSTVDGLEYRESLQVVRIERWRRQQRRARRVRARREPARRAVAARSRSPSPRLYELLGDADTLEVLNASPPAPPNLAHPLVEELVGAGCSACGRSSGGPTSPLRRARDRRVQLRARRSRARAHRRRTPGRRDIRHCAEVLTAYVGLASG